MAIHSVADAKNQLSDLIDRSLAGEGVVITRHGHPVVELTPVPEPPRAVQPGDLDWLTARRLGRPAADGDAGSLLTGIRNQDAR